MFHILVLITCEARPVNRCGTYDDQWSRDRERVVDRNWVQFQKGYGLTQFVETALPGFHTIVPGWAARAA